MSAYDLQTAELAALIREDYARYGKLIKDAGIKGERMSEPRR